MSESGRGEGRWRRWVLRLAASIVVILAGGVAEMSCSHDGGATSCPTGNETCACYGNKTCNSGLTCASNTCVNLSPVGGASGGGTSGGTGGTSGGTGGAPSGTGGSAAGAGGATGSGGMTGGGSGGMASGSGGKTGSGGASGCTCTGTMECTTDGHCVNPNVIDDFADCNATINLIRGRDGGWYAASDVGINRSFAVSTPPSGFSDQQCGAWTTGGPTGNGTTNFALLGVAMTSTGSPVDFSAYRGLSVALEAQAIDFTIKTTNGGYFTRRLTTTAGLQTFNIDFSTLLPRSDSTLLSLNLAGVTDIQFTVIDPSMGYGFVVHGLTLY